MESNLFQDTQLNSSNKFLTKSFECNYDLLCLCCTLPKTKMLHISVKPLFYFFAGTGLTSLSSALLQFEPANFGLQILSNILT